MDFIYQVKNQSGEAFTGTIDAPSEDQAISILHQKSFIILGLQPAQQELLHKDIGSSLSRPSQKDVVVFTRQLATLIDADVPLVNGLHIVASQIDKPSFRKVVNDLGIAIEGGATLSVALADHPKVFSGFYVSLVRAGEISGKLQATLLYLADYLEKSAALTSKIRGALAYPVFVMSALLIVGIIMVTTVLPQLLTIIKDSGVTDLPLTTRILIGVTGFVNHYIVILVILLISVVVLAIYYLKTPAGRAQFDNFIIKVPAVGTITRTLYITRMAETLSTLIKAGVPILQSIAITAEVVGNQVFKSILLEAQTNVQNGGTVSEVFGRYREIPALVTSMLSIGEKTGRTDFMLDNLYNFYKTEADNNINNLSQIIEPALILLLGLGVGVLVSAVLLPIYSLVGAS